MSPAAALPAGTTVNSGGFELVNGALAVASSTIVNAGGAELVFSAGTASNTVLSGGLEVIEGKATGFTVVGSAIATTIDDGGDQIVFGFAEFTTVNSGTEIVWSGSKTGLATINTGGFDFIVGSAIDQTLNGGTEFVVSHGIADETQINGGGVQVVSSGSTAEFGTINAGGTEIVDSGGKDLSTLVGPGGTQFVESGGTASGADVKAGGTQIVEAGGSVISTSINGGVLEVVSGGSTGTAPVSFTANGGDLQLDFSQTFSGLIAGFASPAAVIEEIDLRDIAFTGATKATFTQNGASGTLTVTDGTHTANLTLLGLYSTANFSLSNDGHGGTFITDPPSLVGSAASPVLAAQHT